MVFYSPFEYYYLWLPLIGFIVGMLASMIGGGGGFFFPPVLIVFFNVPAHTAVATSLAATLPICLIGAAGHYRLGNIDVRTGLVFGIAGIIGAVAGASVTGWLSPEQLGKAFGIYALILGVVILFAGGKRDEHTGSSMGNIFSRLFGFIPKGSFYGFAGGVITGTFGTSGTAPVLAGLFAIKLPVKLIAGTSLMVIFMNTVSGFAGHLVLGMIDLTMVWLLTAGTIVGALAGPLITAGFKPGRHEITVRRVFAILILLFGIIMLMT